MAESHSARWEPTGRWRAIRLDTGTLWAESSDEAEVRQRADLASMPVAVQRHMRRVEQRWEDAPDGR